ERTVRAEFVLAQVQVLRAGLECKARAGRDLALEEVGDLGVAHVRDDDARAGDPREEADAPRRDELGLPGPPVSDDQRIGPAARAERALVRRGDRFVLAV